MAKVTLPSLTTSVANISDVNANFAAIQAAFDRVMFLDGTPPNVMSSDLDMNGRNLINVGQVTQSIASQYGTLPFRNTTGGTLVKGQVVVVTGAQAGNLTVALASNTTEGTSATTIGVVDDVSVVANAVGSIRFSYTLVGMNTSAWTEGSALWLGATAGSMTTITPVSPNQLVLIGFVTRSHPTLGEVVVKVQNGYELEELHNVLITSPVAGDVLTYDAPTQLWKNTPAITSTAGKVLKVTTVENSVSISSFLPAFAAPTVALTTADGVPYMSANVTKLSTASTIHYDATIYIGVAVPSTQIYAIAYVVGTGVVNQVAETSTNNNPNIACFPIHIRGSFSGTAGTIYTLRFNIQRVSTAAGTVVLNRDPTTTFPRTSSVRFMEVEA